MWLFLILLIPCLCLVHIRQSVIFRIFRDYWSRAVTLFIIPFLSSRSSIVLYCSSSTWYTQQLTFSYMWVNMFSVSTIVFVRWTIVVLYCTLGEVCGLYVASVMILNCTHHTTVIVTVPVYELLYIHICLSRAHILLCVN